MMEEISLGQQKVGNPQREVVEALIEELGLQPWPNFNRAVAMYYMERMLFSQLLSLLQNALSEQDLKVLEEKQVHWLHLVLLRDHFRHNADLLLPSEPETWVDSIFDNLFKQFEIPESMHKRFDVKFDLDTFNAEWARTLSEPFGMRSDKLFVSHSAIVTGPREEL